MLNDFLPEMTGALTEFIKTVRYAIRDVWPGSVLFAMRLLN